MNSFTQLYTVTICLLCTSSIAQTYNAKDDLGRKQGTWVYLGKDMPHKPDYKPTDTVQYGTYVDSRKQGVWKNYYPRNRIKSEISYKNNRPHGTYRKYYTTESGPPVLVEEANLIRHKYVGPHKTYFDNGCIKQKVMHDEQGKIIYRVIYGKGCTVVSYHMTVVDSIVGPIKPYRYGR